VRWHHDYGSGPGYDDYHHDYGSGSGYDDYHHDCGSGSGLDGYHHDCGSGSGSSLDGCHHRTCGKDHGYRFRVFGFVHPG